MSAPPESFPGTQHTILCPPTSPPPEPNRQRDRQRDREARRRRRREEAAAQHLQQLEDNARFLYRLGFFALPLLWLIALIYFHREHIDENASPVIKSYYNKSRLMLVIYTTIFVIWVIVFYSMQDTLSSFNILNFKGQSISGI